MRYFGGPESVDAQQYDGSFDLDFLRQGESVRSGAPDGSQIVLRCDAGTVTVAKGEWVIRDEEVGFRVLADRRFRSWYVVPEEADR